MAKNLRPRTLEEHLISCLGEEASEIVKDLSKITRFGLHDRNFLNPTVPSNVENLVGELNDLLGVVQMLVRVGVIPARWKSAKKQERKRNKVRDCMRYAIKVGALEKTAVQNYDHPK